MSRTFKLTFFAAAVAALTACSDPMGPTPVDADQPSLGGTVRIDPTGPADAPSFGGAVRTDPTDPADGLNY